MNQSVWIPRAQDGDRTAVAQLFEQTVQPVYYLCCKLTGSAAQAGSLTRRTFDRAFSELSSIRPGVSFSRWTMAIAVNLCRQQLAASQPELLRTDEAEQAMLNDTYVTGEDCLPAACVTDEALQEQALQAVDQLPPRQRVCLYLHSYAKLQPAQIARVLGLPEVTVLGRLNCARYTLRTLLEPLSPTPLSPEMLHGSCLQTAWQAAQATPEQPQSDDEPEDEADVADGTDEPERRKLTKKQKILIGVGAGLLLAVIVLVCVLLGGKDKTPDEIPAPVEQVDTNRRLAERAAGLRGGRQSRRSAAADAGIRRDGQSGQPESGADQSGHHPAGQSGAGRKAAGLRHRRRSAPELRSCLLPGAAAV